MILTYRIAMAAAQDAGNRAMRKARRAAWSDDDHAAACAEFDRLMPFLPDSHPAKRPADRSA